MFASSIDGLSAPNSTKLVTGSVTAEVAGMALGTVDARVDVAPVVVTPPLETGLLVDELQACNTATASAPNDVASYWRRVMSSLMNGSAFL